MATLSRLIFYPILILFFLGKLFPYIDIFIILFAITNLFSQTNFLVKNKPLLIFIIIATISNLLYFNFTGWLYLIRLISLISLLIYPPHFDKKQNQFIDIILISTLVFGYLQYFIYPDFTIFSALNWDPHLYRLVGSYFDPTFTGEIYLLILIYIFFSTSKFKNILLTTNYIAISLTYSRSTLISFLIVFSYIFFIQKKFKNILIVLLIFISTLFVLPRMPGEGTKLERTSSIFAKIENYQQGINVFSQNPLIGIGYNNIYLLNYKNNHSSHSNSGFDGSLLNIAITTGLIGLIFFLLGLRHELYHGSLFYQSLLISLLIHSLFANSLFYPYTFFLLTILHLKTQK